MQSRLDLIGLVVNTTISTSIAVNALMPAVSQQWFAVQTRSRHEKKATDELRRRGIDVFLPLMTNTRRWSDRTKKIELPLFSGYAFVNIVPEPRTRVQVLSANGVVRFVGPTSAGTPIPTEEIEGIRTALANEIALRPLPFVKIGQRVRIRSGVLAGMEGILTGARGDRQLIVSISTINKSVSLAIEGYDIDPI